jgi:hypothetical protein
VGEIEFSEARLLQQAAGNQSAMFLVSLAFAKKRDGSVDAYAEFVGEEFAESWDELKGAGAMAVARMTGMNFASSADSKLVALNGDDSRAEAVIEGPDPEWLTGTSVTTDDSDHANEIIFRKIAEHLDLRLETHRDDAGLHLVFSKP